MRESLIAQIRNPTQAFVKRVRALNYGNCYYFETAEMDDLDKLDVGAACEHFTQCYQNPAEYTVCMTGQIEVWSPLLTTRSKLTYGRIDTLLGRQAHSLHLQPVSKTALL